MNDNQNLSRSLILISKTLIIGIQEKNLFFTRHWIFFVRKNSYRDEKLSFHWTGEVRKEWRLFPRGQRQRQPRFMRKEGETWTRRFSIKRQKITYDEDLMKCETFLPFAHTQTHTLSLTFSDTHQKIHPHSLSLWLSYINTPSHTPITHTHTLVLA